jgi:hypothetical protein
MRIEDVHSYFW